MARQNYNSLLNLGSFIFQVLESPEVTQLDLLLWRCLRVFALFWLLSPAQLFLDHCIPYPVFFWSPFLFF